MAKLKVKIETVCATDPTGRAPFIESLRVARKQALPAKTFYWLNKISAVLEKEFTEYEEARIRLVMEFGTPNPAGTGYTIAPEKVADFNRELATLSGEIELPIEEGVKLALPANGVAEDWFFLMTTLDIFEEPA